MAGRAVCPCGWRSATKKDRAHSRRALARHLRFAHRVNPADAHIHAARIFPGTAAT